MTSDTMERNPIDNAMRPMYLSFLKKYQRMTPVILEKKRQITEKSTNDPQSLVNTQLPLILELWGPGIIWSQIILFQKLVRSLCIDAIPCVRSALIEILCPGLVTGMYMLSESPKILDISPSISNCFKISFAFSNLVWLGSRTLNLTVLSTVSSTEKDQLCQSSCQSIKLWFSTRALKENIMIIGLINRPVCK